MDPIQGCDCGNCNEERWLREFLKIDEPEVSCNETLFVEQQVAEPQISSTRKQEIEQCVASQQ